VAASEATAVEDLEALFETMSADRQREITAQHAKPSELAGGRLFAGAGEPGAVPPAAGIVASEGMYNRIGTLTRQLHDALRELGYDKAIESSAAQMPDARDRLGYIAKLTGQAADRALAAVDAGQIEQRLLHDQASKLSGLWEQFFGGGMKIENFKSLAHDTRIFMVQAQARSEATQHQLTEIMMAQDFHDLTGQVINRLSAIVQKMESEMLRVLIETLPAERKLAINADDLEGPQINGSSRPDVVTNQAQVDDLLESLGF
jgi:chemotaxis protein CheZ